MADDTMPRLKSQAPHDLFGRPFVTEMAKNLVAQGRVAFEPRSRPASGSRLLLGIGRLVTHRAAGVALQLSRDRRWRAIQSCRDLPQRLPLFMKTGNRAAFFQ
jgi:hypothetical protein